MRMRKLTAVFALAVGLVLLGAAAPAWAGDVDGDGVDDPMDVCNNTPPGTAVDAVGRPLGDVDLDCDTDLEDHGLSQQGFTGPLAFAGFMETVPVGNPGNPGESSGDFKTCICGGVDYVYQIGKFEVTAGQYAEFLNAVAATDTYQLYNPNMNGDSLGCQITRHGASGSYTYDFSGRPSGTEADWVDRPVNYVGWGDAARFANWMHNGQPTGDQNICTTEDGSYELFGATTDPVLLGIRSEPDATWVIPSEDEWYKAAYHKNDGPTANYFDYPTSSDIDPSYLLIDPDPGNNATFRHDDGQNFFWTIDAPFWRTEAGAHENSVSPYGTFDQGGNVWEWNEAADGLVVGSGRGLRGSSWSNSLMELRAARRRHAEPTFETDDMGFRVAKRR